MPSATPPADLAGKIAIAGIGASRFGRFPEQTDLSFAATALVQALDDSGLSKEDLDGLIVQIGHPRGSDYDRVAEALGLSPRFCSQTWSHGRFAATLLQHAGMAVNCGLADYVACFMAFNNTRFGLIGETGNPFFVEGYREGGGPHGEMPVFGMTSPGAGAALAARRYFDLYGIPPERLGAVAVAFRKHASLNPNAMMRTPITLQDYLAAPFIVEPLRRLDYSQVNDGAVCAIVTSAERARDCRKAPVLLNGFQGIHAGRDEFPFGMPGLGIAQQPDYRYALRPEELRVYSMAGVTPREMDALYVYDAFSIQVPFTLERFGFCGPGEAADWIQGGRIELGGELPMNTNGGQLSEAHMNGWGQIAEIVRQLRGEAGPRQLPNPRLIQWATCIGDSIVFGRD